MCGQCVHLLLPVPCLAIFPTLRSSNRSPLNPRARTDSSVPHLAELKSKCFLKIEAYKLCLDSSANLPDEMVREKCAGALSDLWKCTEGAMADIEARK